MTPASSTYRWEEGGLRPIEDRPPGPLLVGDSWRQVDGHVRRLDLHRDRFAAAVEEAAGLDARDFVEAAAARVPASGEWFPRVSLVGADLLLDVRPGPPRVPTVAVRVLPPGDPRSSPLVKGPDLALCGELVAAARASGADEIVVRDRDGLVLEAGWAAIVWWDGDDLCAPARSLPVLPSVTRAIVEGLARSRGHRVREVRARIEDLDARETWLLNAYQGVRLVTEWSGASLTAGAGHRFGEWRAAVDDHPDDGDRPDATSR